MVPWLLLSVAMDRSVVTVGVFDGMHLGHRALIERALGEAQDAARVVVCAFDPHPLRVIRPEVEPARLSIFWQRRRACFAEMGLREGVDEVVRLGADPDLLGMSARAFCAMLVERFGMCAIVEGEDFRFGRGREGDVRTLRELGASMGFAVHVVEPVEVVLGDHAIVRASSSTVRRLLAHGRVTDAACVLGRPHQLIGEVVRGDRRGRELGYPTANLACEVMAPADGVYAARATLDDGRRFDAAVSVGVNPQFGDRGRRAEAYLIDAPREGDAIAGLGEYGWTLRLDLVAWLREQLVFAGVEELVAQIERDVARVGRAIADARAQMRVVRELREAACG